MPVAFLESNFVTLILLCLAVFRIYLEVIRFNFQALPLTKSMAKERGQNIHKMGFYFSLGYFVLFAPGYLLS